jgi:catechol-2,3-dioxygenase
MLFGAERTYCHVFFGLADGSALAFFQFAKPEDAEQFGPEMPFTPFHHIALKVEADVQSGIEQRLKAAGYEAPQMFVLEHGYCRSLYATDPNGMIVEFTVDHPEVNQINTTRLKTAHADLKRWLGGE